jgi:hypothetical protein
MKAAKFKLIKKSVAYVYINRSILSNFLAFFLKQFSHGISHIVSGSEHSALYLLDVFNFLKKFSKGYFLAITEI